MHLLPWVRFPYDTTIVIKGWRPGRAKKGGLMEIGLDNGGVIGIDGSAQAFTLRCLAGCLWLTRSGDSRDYFLTAGMTMAFGRDDAVVAEAWGEARILFQCPGESKQAGAVPQVWHLVGSP